MDLRPDAIHVHHPALVYGFTGSTTDQMVGRDHFRLSILSITGKKPTAEPAITGHQHESGLGRTNIVRFTIIGAIIRSIPDQYQDQDEASPAPTYAHRISQPFHPCRHIHILPYLETYLPAR